MHSVCQRDNLLQVLALFQNISYLLESKRAPPPAHLAIIETITPSMSTIVESLSAEEKREALNLVFQSRTFARSDRLKNLLASFARRISKAAAAISTNTQSRWRHWDAAGFSPGEDSSVRSRAYELRRKLEKLYATEACDTSLRIQIPKGSYLPRFTRTARLRSTEAPVQPAVLPVVPEARHRSFLPLLAAFLAGTVLTAGGLAVWNGVFSKQAPGRCLDARPGSDLEADDRFQSAHPGVFPEPAFFCASVR